MLLTIRHSFARKRLHRLPERFNSLASPLLPLLVIQDIIVRATIVLRSFRHGADIEGYVFLRPAAVPSDAALLVALCMAGSLKHRFS